MKNFKIRAACGILIAAMGITGITGCGTKTLDGTKTVVSVNKNEIPLGVASFAVRYAQAQTEYYYASFAAMYGMDAGSELWDAETESGITHGEETKNDILDKLEKMYLVRDHAKEYGVEVTEDEKAKIKETAKDFIEKNDEATLKRIGVTQSDIEEYLELQTYFTKSNTPMVADIEIEVKDSEAAQSTLTYTFLSTKDVDDSGKESLKNKIQGLLDEYKANEDIAALDMKAFTEEKDEGYLTSTASYGEDDTETSLDAAVREAAKDLTDGQLYDGIVEGEAGYFIVRMDKVLDEEATETKRESVKAEKKQEAFEALIQGWLDEADVTLDKGVWKKVKLTDKESYSIKVEETPAAEEDVVDTSETAEPDNATETPEETAEETPAETPAE